MTAIKKSRFVQLCCYCIMAVFLISVLYPFAVKADESKSISNKTTITIEVNHTVQLRVNHNGKESVKWKSSNTGVAKVSKKGRVKGVAPGTAVISAKVGTDVLRCHVTVIEKKVIKPYIRCYNLEVSGHTSVSGDTFQFRIMNSSSGDRWSWSINTPDTAEFMDYKEGDSFQRIKTFYGRPGKVIITAKSGSKIVTYEFFLQMDPKQEAMVRLRQDVLSQLLHPGMPAQEQCLAIAKWLSDYASYVITNGPRYSILSDRVGQCMHYAYAYDFLLDPTGIPCDYVNDDDHAWNQVLIDGQWYNVDVTCFDCDRADEPYWYNMFMVSDYVFWRKGPREGLYHECISTRYDFAEPFSDSPWATGTWVNN